MTHQKVLILLLKRIKSRSTSYSWLLDSYFEPYGLGSVNNKHNISQPSFTEIFVWNRACCGGRATHRDRDIIMTPILFGAPLSKISREHKYLSKHKENNRYAKVDATCFLSPSREISHLLCAASVCFSFFLCFQQNQSKGSKI